MSRALVLGWFALVAVAVTASGSQRAAAIPVTTKTN